jgi:hypothetical protein
MEIELSSNLMALNFGNNVVLNLYIYKLQILYIYNNLVYNTLVKDFLSEHFNDFELLRFGIKKLC